MPWDEKIVCLDPTLAALDRTRAAAFARARKDVAPAAARTLASTQKAWLRDRRETCNAAHRYSCVKALYERRIAELSKPK
jgi:uncharacterized protein